MANWQTQNQGFLGTSPGSAAWMTDPDLLTQISGQSQLSRQNSRQQAELLARQQEYAAGQQAADRAFQGDQAAANRTFQGQMLEATGANQRQLASDQFGYQKSLAQQQYEATAARDQSQFGYTRQLAGDQFGYQRQLAQQQNGFQQALLGMQQAGQRQLSAQEARQVLERDQGLFTNQQTMQGRDLSSRKELAQLQDSGETGRLGMSIGQQRYQADLNAQLAREQMRAQQDMAAAPLALAREKFNRVMGMMSGLSGDGGGFSSTTPQFDPAAVSGRANAPRQVYTDQQMAEQVNAQMASNARRATEQARDATNSAAARGMSTRSAATQSLLQGIEAARMGEDAVARREIPFQAAQANTDAAARAAALDEQARQANIAGLVNQRQIQANQRNAMLAALAGAI